MTHKLEHEGPFHRWEDARSKKIEIERQIDRHEYAPKADRAVPLQQYIESLLAADKKLRQTSREAYESRLRVHIQGTKFGETPIGQITPPRLRDYWGNLDIGNGALLSLYQLLAKTFNAAVAEGLFSVSPFRRAKIGSPSKERQKEIEPLPAEHIEALADAAETPRDRIAILLGGYCGLRAGEVGGLRVQDIDFLARRLSIQQATYRTRKTRGVGALKTKYSRRKISIPEFLLEEIARYLETNPPAPDGRIMYTRDFGELEHIRLNKVVHAAAKRAGLPPVHFHLLRHTCAALLIKQGIMPKQIQSYMGHSSIRVTMDIYGHLYDQAGEEIATKMQDIRAEALNGGKVVRLPVQGGA